MGRGASQQCGRSRRAWNLRRRCIMTRFDPDTLEQDVDVLRAINARFDGTLALNCVVLRGGELGPGDTAELVDRSWAR